MQYTQLEEAWDIEGGIHQQHVVLLDWWEAFDKVMRAEMFTAMERMEIDTNSSI